MVCGDGNGARYRLLRHLAPAEPSEEFELFYRESMNTILHHLSRPSEEDADFFSELALEDGAHKFLRESVSCFLTSYCTSLTHSVPQSCPQIGGIPAQSKYKVLVYTGVEAPAHYGVVGSTGWTHRKYHPQNSQVL